MITDSHVHSDRSSWMKTTLMKNNHNKHVVVVVVGLLVKIEVAAKAMVKENGKERARTMVKTRANRKEREKVESPVKKHTTKGHHQ